MFKVCELDADIVGVRGAACTLDDRTNGQITREKVRDLKEIVMATKNL